MDNVKLEHFRNLISLSAADGKIEESERIALAKIAFENGIPPDRLGVMLQRANEYAYLIPQNNQDREKQMHDMIDLAVTDGDFAKAERDLIEMVGGKLGFSVSEIVAIIDGHLRK